MTSSVNSTTETSSATTADANRDTINEQEAARAQQIGDDYNTAMTDLKMIEQISGELDETWDEIMHIMNENSDYGDPHYVGSPEKWVNDHLSEEEIECCEEGGVVVWVSHDSKDWNGYYDYNEYIIWYDSDNDSWHVYTHERVATHSNWALYNAVTDYNNLLFGYTNEDGEYVKGLYDYEDELMAIDSSNQIADLISSLNQLMNESRAVYISAGARTDTEEEKKDIQSYEESLFSAMENQLEVDKNIALLDSDNLTLEQMQTYSSALASAQTAELGTLTVLQNRIRDDEKKYSSELDDANVAHSKAKAEVTKTLGASGEAEREETRREMHDLRRMLVIMNELLSGLTDVISSLQPDFTQFNCIFKQVKAEIDAVVDDASLSTSEKVSAVMALLIYLLGFVDSIKTTAEESISENQKHMTDANMKASEMNLHQMESNQKIVAIAESLKKFEKDMKIVQTCAEIAMAVAFVALTVATCGVGAAIAVAVMSSVEMMMSHGVIDFDPVEYVQQKTGCNKVEAEAIVAVAEFVITCGAGFAADLGLAALKTTEQAVATAVTQAVNSLDTVFEEAVNTAMERAAQSSGGQAVDEMAVRETLEQGMRAASKKSVELTIQQYVQQNAVTVVQGLLGEGLQNAIEKAALKGAEQGLEASVGFAERQGTLYLLEAEEQETINQVLEIESAEMAKNVSYQVTAEQMNIKVADLVRRVEPTREDHLLTLGRVGLGLFAAMAHNHVFSDGVGLWMQKRGIDRDSKNYMVGMMIAQILEGMGQMAAFNYAGGRGSWSGGQVVNMLDVASNGLSVAGMGMTSATEGYQYMVAKLKALGIVENGKTKVEADALKQILESMNNQFNGQKQGALQEMQKSSQLTTDLAQHTQDGIRAGIEVLAAAAV